MAAASPTADESGEEYPPLPLRAGGPGFDHLVVLMYENRSFDNLLGRLYDGIEYRGFRQAAVEALARESHVPVWNGLTDDFHPTQVLADLLTMEEFGEKPLSALSFCYAGDARFNMGNSLLIAGTQMGMDVRIAAPRELWPNDDLVARMRRLAQRTGATIGLTEDAQAGVKGAATGARNTPPPFPVLSVKGEPP